jgi:hypothetical protein
LATYLVDAKSIAVQTVNITSDPFTNSFTLSTSSSLGDWRVIVYDPLGGTVQQVTTFSVIDSQDPSVDVQVDKGPVSSSTSAGAQVVFCDSGYERWTR